MILWENPITDRTQSDVQRVLELLNTKWSEFSAEDKEKWLSGEKGAINRTDYERIQNNIQLLSDVLELDLVVSIVPPIPTQSFFDEILQNTDTIRGAYMIHADTPQTPVHPLNTYQKWNDIEKILDDVYGILLNNFNYYCGNEIYAGEETGLLL